MLTNWLLALGFTRDSAVWLWGRLTSGALIIATGLVPLDAYIGTTGQKTLTVVAAIVLWLSGKYDTSPLPGKRL